MTFISVIIAAGGTGKRFKSIKGKQLFPLKNIPILVRTVNKFKDIADEIIITADKKILQSVKKTFKRYKVVLGGKERSESIKNGLKVLSPKATIVLVHDGARPLVSIKIIKNVISAAKKDGAAVPSVLVKDTIKMSGPKKYVRKTINRSMLYSIQTPQGFKKEILVKAYKGNVKGATDDAYLVEKLGYKVKIVEGDYSNIKITTPEDILIAETILKRENRA